MIGAANAIEALNSKLRRAIRSRGHFPSDDAAAKLLYLVLNHGLETAAVRMVRGEDAVRRYVQRALRARMTENRVHAFFGPREDCPMYYVKITNIGD